MITFRNSMYNSNLPEFIEIGDTFKNWLPYIVNSFNKNEKPLPIPKPIDKIKYDKIGHFKPRKKDKLK